MTELKKESIKNLINKHRDHDVFRRYNNINFYVYTKLRMIHTLNINVFDKRRLFLEMMCTILHFEKVSPEANNGILSRSGIVRELIIKIDRMYIIDYESQRWRWLLIKKRLIRIMTNRGRYNVVVVNKQSHK